MIEKTLTIVNRYGLHARAANKFVSCAASFGADITVTKDQQSGDGKSIMAIMMLAATMGTEITLRAQGGDEQAAMDALVALINNRFDEAE